MDNIVEYLYVGPTCYELRFLHNQFYLYENGRYTGKWFVTPSAGVRYLKEVMRNADVREVPSDQTVG
jgi:hypothetical protein